MYQILEVDHDIEDNVFCIVLINMLIDYISNVLIYLLLFYLIARQYFRKT